MGKKSERTESLSDKEEGGAKIDTPVGDAMDVDSTPAPADARAARAARRKQRREELASQGLSATSSSASTPNPETEPAAAKSEKKSKKKSDRKSTSKKSENADVEAEAPAATPEAPAPAPAAEPLPFVIDVKPSKPAVANIDTDSHSTSERGGSVAPSTVNGGDGLNRAARRRLMQIEKHRGLIKKDLGIPAESNERQDEVDSLLAEWTAKFDEKAEIRAAKKMAKKEEIKSKGKAKGKGRGKQGRNSNDNQRQMKKQKQKQALRARQEAGSGTN